ncbi:hypothetical protein PDG61_16820 [Mycolicibacterium sp. BiH015]|uniref:hypothetical protein n=1 Tax=Mycolicibacterium sp. BiH015 TaxID=3018808 RepID=UPI0022E427B7|nr:hypothetical protein [Mycolicibacterium sp. BiH015]MDA2892585.1 hypothetical protein [Mycolicibacterium sp. BiH015]
MLQELTELGTWVDLATVVGVLGALYVVRRDGKRTREEERVRRGDQARTVTLEFEDGIEEAYQVGMPTKSSTFIIGTLTNHSERPLLDVRFELPENPQIRLADTPHGDNVAVARVVLGGQSASAWFEVKDKFDWAEFLNLHVRFTDANGVRWRRTEYTPPQEILEPPRSLRERLRSRRQRYTGTIDDFYESAIGAREVKGLSARAFRLGHEIAYWKGQYYYRQAAAGRVGGWTQAKSLKEATRYLDRIESEASELEN